MTDTQVYDEVAYQCAEYGIDTPEAIENVADETGRSFADVSDAFSRGRIATVTA